MKRTKIGIIGCGVISSRYQLGMSFFPFLELAAVADLNNEVAQAKASEWNVRALTIDELLVDDRIEIVLNLTIPAAHAQVDELILKAGKHPYSEKPLALEVSQAQKVLSLALENNLRVGCAPDTILGGGIQTCRKLIDDGWIGQPVAATAFTVGRGVERWHPNPNFYYEKGGGPLFDMGPYYLSALINLLGSAKRVSGAANISFKERIIKNPKIPERWGEKIPVEIPTHVSANLEFNSGAVATLVASFDVVAANLPRIEIYGSEGSISVPDPNTFGGPVKFKSSADQDWKEIPLICSCVEPGRGLGVAEMAVAIIRNNAHRANGEVAMHVLEIMESIHQSSEMGKHVELNTSCERPDLLHENLQELVW